MIQQWLGLGEALGFAGDTMVLLPLSTFVYGYGRWPFLTGLVDELRERMPGMMTLVTFAGYFRDTCNLSTKSTVPKGCTCTRGKTGLSSFWGRFVLSSRKENLLGHRCFSYN